MSNSIFGWSYPPGVTSVPGDEATYCPGCGLNSEDWPEEWTEPTDAYIKSCTDDHGKVYCSPSCIENGVSNNIAYDLGRTARMEKQTLNDNPYGPGMAHISWEEGYLEEDMDINYRESTVDKEKS
jgi:hypothetical protein